MVKQKELVLALEMSIQDIDTLIENMQEDYQKENRGIELIKVEDSYQLCTKKELYEYLYPVFDKRSKPSLSQAALETLAIIAYNPKITRAEIEAIRGVNSADACVYKLLEYGLIEECWKSRFTRQTINVFYDTKLFKNVWNIRFKRITRTSKI